MTAVDSLALAAGSKGPKDNRPPRGPRHEVRRPRSFRSVSDGGSPRLTCGLVVAALLLAAIALVAVAR